MENEFDYNLDLPVNIGISGTIMDLLTSILERKNKETQFEREFNFNVLQGYKRKHEKWTNVLKNDLLTKAKYTEIEVSSILSSNFVDLYFNKYLKKIYNHYFIMGFTKNTKVEEKVFKQLKPQIDKISNELLDLIKKNTSEQQFTTIYGPIVKSFIYDAYDDGTSYSVFTALNRMNSY